jgi:hypothetical protein
MAEALAVSSRLAALTARSVPATSALPESVAPPAAASVVLPVDVRLASVSASALASVAVVATLRSPEAEMRFCSSTLPAAVSVKSPALAAASPSMRTPTPASVEVMRMRLAYMPPSAAVSMAYTGALPVGVAAPVMARVS